MLLLFRRRPDASLLRWAAALMVVPVLSYLLLYGLFAAFVSPEMLGTFEVARADFYNNAVREASQGTYLQIATGFNLNYAVGRYLGLIFDMRLPKILAMFLLGLYAYRRGYLMR